MNTNNEMTEAKARAIIRRTFAEIDYGCVYCATMAVSILAEQFPSVDWQTIMRQEAQLPEWKLPPSDT